MICMSGEQGMIRIAFSGDLNRNNILSIREDILGLHHVAEVEGKTDWPIRIYQGRYLPAKTAFAQVYPV